MHPGANGKNYLRFALPASLSRVRHVQRDRCPCPLQGVGDNGGGDADYVAITECASC